MIVSRVLSWLAILALCCADSSGSRSATCSLCSTTRIIADDASRFMAYKTNNLPLSVPRGGGRGKKGDLSKVDVPSGKVSAGRMLEFHKALWLPVSVGFMVLTRTYTVRAALMAGFFSAYGILWVIKSYTFWDVKFYNAPSSHLGPGELLITWCTVSLYFLFPFLAVQNKAPISVVETFTSSFLFTVGGFLHYAADAQKFFTLKYKGPSLITEGLFARTRHPSYMGEYLMFIGMAVISGARNPLAWVPIASLLTVTLVTTMPQKEKSLSRYPEYEDWKAKTGMILPKLF